MNFDDISKKLKEFSQTTVEEVQKLNEVRQLNADISNEKKKINSVYMEIGRKMFHLYKEEPLTGFESELQSLKASFRKIDGFQEQIRIVKGVRLCPHCKSEVKASERFCPNCGSRMPEDFTVENAEVLEHQEGETLNYQAGVYEDTVEAEKKPADTGENAESVNAEAAGAAEPADAGEPGEAEAENTEAAGAAEPADAGEPGEAETENTEMGKEIETASAEASKAAGD